MLKVEKLDGREKRTIEDGFIHPVLLKVHPLSSFCCFDERDDKSCVLPDARHDIRGRRNTRRPSGV